PVLACSNLYDMYYAHSMNMSLAAVNDAGANVWADEVERCFERDRELTEHYHRISGGKWNHMMDQIHIGYTSWNHPDRAICPEVCRVQVGTHDGNIFDEVDGCVSIEAEHYSRCEDGVEAGWTVIPELGRTLSGITTMPCTASIDGMSLEYDIRLKTSGCLKVIVRFAPTLNYNVSGHSYAVSFDDGEEQTVNINGDYDGHLGRIQAEHVIDGITVHNVPAAGRHILRVRPLSPGMVIQKIMIDAGGLKPSYLGAPETRSHIQ
ncbi:MAG: glycosyhydrolase, partial [Muribaculaceae bacterium]|nr:glycosyhydrolase [Muribaculaceae bacterium]